MSDIKSALGTATAFTITLNSLGASTSAGRESTVIDNTTNLYLDALVEVLVSFPNSAPGSSKAIYIWAYGSLDGTNYTGACTGADAGYTRDNPTVLALLGSIPIPTQNKVYRSRPFSVARAFGGQLPRKWGIVVQNDANQTLNGSGCSAQYLPIYRTVS